MRNIVFEKSRAACGPDYDYGTGPIDLRLGRTPITAGLCPTASDDSESERATHAHFTVGVAGGMLNQARNFTPAFCPSTDYSLTWSAVAKRLSIRPIGMRNVGYKPMCVPDAPTSGPGRGVW